jgi:hypothetical protein
MKDPLEVSKLYTVHGSKPRPSILMVLGSKEQVPSGSKVILTITAKVVDVTLLIHRRCLLEVTTSIPVVHPFLDKGIMNNRWRGRRFVLDSEESKKAKLPSSRHFINTSNGKTFHRILPKSNRTKHSKTNTGIGFGAFPSFARLTDDQFGGSFPRVLRRPTDRPLRRPTDRSQH